MMSIYNKNYFLQIQTAISITTLFTIERGENPGELVDVTSETLLEKG